MAPRPGAALRIVGGTWRGRALQAPPGDSTRPTAARVRQALFDMLAHAPWAGRGLLNGARVLDAFAGSGALGLEALSRGAIFSSFIERDRTALSAIFANIEVCRAETMCRVIAGDVRHPPPGIAQTVIFLDPPYEKSMLQPAVDALRAAEWIGCETLIVAESGLNEVFSPHGQVLARRAHGAAQLVVWREEFT